MLYIESMVSPLHYEYIWKVLQTIYRQFYFTNKNVYTRLVGILYLSYVCLIVHYSYKATYFKFTYEFLLIIIFRKLLYQSMHVYLTMLPVNILLTNKTNITNLLLIFLFSFTFQQQELLLKKK